MDSALELVNFMMQHPQIAFTLQGELGRVRVVARSKTHEVAAIVSAEAIEQSAWNLLLFHMDDMVKQLEKAAA